MEEYVLMPKLGLTMTRGMVSKWKKQINEPVKKDEVICEVETEKITSDVNAPFDGYIKEILVQENEEQEVLKPICLIKAY
jgi:pyruvate/2-oxoglutarate dehydrogenase complex dihydrolipoamide acyltransferase (E2) component